VGTNADAALRRVLYGTDEEIPDGIPLNAGPLALTLRGSKLWHLRSADAEVWHGVAFLFRDADWGTPEPIVEHIEQTLSDSAFDVRIAGRFAVDPAIDFALHIEGDQTGRITFTGEACPRADILASRMGLCVMHPMSACGTRIEVEHTDGRTSRSTFPTLIPAWPPFMLIRALRHEYAPGCWAHCAFDGDAFELEDQRNNSDASFKTYSRSNLMPRPYWLRAGVPIRQSVELQLETQSDTASGAAIANARSGNSPAARGMALGVASEMAPVRVGVAAADGGVMPAVGIEIAASDASAGDAVHAALRALRPAHLHLAVDANAAAVDWHGVRRLLTIADAELRLDVAIDYADPDALHSLGRTLRDAGVAPSRVAVFPSEARCLDAARDAFSGALIGGGTPHFFVQLNRSERLGACEFLSFTTSPIVHGADDESVMLTLQSLPSMIGTLRAAYPDARFAVGPSLIGARRSPLGRQPRTDGLHRVALARSDPRCRGLYGAAWALGYVAQFARAGVDALTLMSLTGDSGVVADDVRGIAVRHPVYWILQRVCRPARVSEVVTSDSTRIAAIGLCRSGESELLLANLTGDTVEVHVDVDGWGPASSCAILDAQACASAALATDAWTAARRPLVERRLRLGPYAVADIIG
jgi:hypothetical protein